MAAKGESVLIKFQVDASGAITAVTELIKAQDKLAQQNKHLATDLANTNKQEVQHYKSLTDATDKFRTSIASAYQNLAKLSNVNTVLSATEKQLAALVQLKTRLAQPAQAQLINLAGKTDEYSITRYQKLSELFVKVNGDITRFQNILSRIDKTPIRAVNDAIKQLNTELDLLHSKKAALEKPITNRLATLAEAEKRIVQQYNYSKLLGSGANVGSTYGKALENDKKALDKYVQDVRNASERIKQYRIDAINEAFNSMLNTHKKESALVAQSEASLKRLADSERKLAIERENRIVKNVADKIEWQQLAATKEREAALRKIQSIEEASIQQLQRLAEQEQRLQAVAKERLATAQRLREEFAATNKAILSAKQSSAYLGVGTASGTGYTAGKTVGTTIPYNTVDAKRTMSLAFGTKTLAQVRAEEAAAQSAAKATKDYAVSQDALAKSLHTAAEAHKPLLARIFDYVVGYRLVNTAVNAFTRSLRDIPASGLKFEQSYATMKAVFTITEDVNKEFAMLDKLAEEAGVSIETLRDSFTDFAASAKFSGESVANINEIFQNLTRAGTVLHLPADRMKAAFTAINQMYAKNQVMMEELKRQLGNQLPAAVNIFAASMGKTTKQLMEDMKRGMVFPKETLLNFSRMYAQIFADPKAFDYASQGINAQMQRLSTAWTNFTTAIYKSTSGAMKGGLQILTGALKLLTENIDKLLIVSGTLLTTLTISMIPQLARTVSNWILYKNAVMASTGALQAHVIAQRAAILANGQSVASAALGAALPGSTTTVMPVGGITGLGTLLKNIATGLSPLTKIALAIGGIVAVLHDLKLGMVEITDEASKTTKQLNITFGDLLLNSLNDVWEDIKTVGSGIKSLISGIMSFAETAARAIGLPSDSVINFFTFGEYDKVKKKKEAELRQQLKDNAYEQALLKSKEAILKVEGTAEDTTVMGVSKRTSEALKIIESSYDYTISQIENRLAKLTATSDAQATLINNKLKLGQMSELDATRALNKIAQEKRRAELESLERKRTETVELLKQQTILNEQLITTSKQGKALAEAKDILAQINVNASKVQELNKEGFNIPTFSTEKELASFRDSEKFKTLAGKIAEYNASHAPETGFTPLDINKLLISTEKVQAATEKANVAQANYDKLAIAHMNISEKILSATGDAIEVQKEIRDALKQPTNTIIPASTAASSSSAVTLTPSASYSSNIVSTTNIQDFLAKNPRAAKYADMIIATANKYGVDPLIALNLIKKESSFNPSATSSVGAAGLMQLMPGTAATYGVSANERYDAEKNVNAGMQYLSDMIKTFNSTVLGVAAYNAGEGNSKKPGAKFFLNPQNAGYLLNPDYNAASNLYRNQTADYVNKIFIGAGQRDVLLQQVSSIVKAGTRPEETMKTVTSFEKQTSEIAVKRISDTAQKTAEDTQELLLQLQEPIRQSSDIVLRQEKELQYQLDAISRRQDLTPVQQEVEKAAIASKFQPTLIKSLQALYDSTAKQLEVEGLTTDKIAAIKAELRDIEERKAKIIDENNIKDANIALQKTKIFQSEIEQLSYNIDKQLRDATGYYSTETDLLDFKVQNQDTYNKLAEEEYRIQQLINAGKYDEASAAKESVNLMNEKLDILEKYQELQNQINREEQYRTALGNVASADIAASDSGLADKFGVGSKWLRSSAIADAAQQRIASGELGSLQNTINAKEQLLGKEGNTPTVIAQLTADIQNARTQMRDLQIESHQFLVDFSSESVNMIGDAFLAWTNGTASAKDALRSLGMSFAQMIQQMLMEELKLQMMKGLTSLFSGMFGSGGSVASGIFGGGASANTGGYIPSFNTGNIVAFPRGGMVRGSGTAISDSISALVPSNSYIIRASSAEKLQRVNLSNGEMVIPPELVAQNGKGFYDNINKGNFASGGIVNNVIPFPTSGTSVTKSGDVYNIVVNVQGDGKDSKRQGQEIGQEIVRQIAKQEASKQVNLLVKQQRNAKR